MDAYAAPLATKPLGGTVSVQLRVSPSGQRSVHVAAAARTGQLLFVEQAIVLEPHTPSMSELVQSPVFLPHDDQDAPEELCGRIDDAIVLLTYSRLAGKMVRDKSLPCMDQDERAYFAGQLGALVEAGYVRDDSAGPGNDYDVFDGLSVYLERLCYCESLASADDLPFVVWAVLLGFGKRQTKFLLHAMRAAEDPCNNAVGKRMTSGSVGSSTPERKTKQKSKKKKVSAPDVISCKKGNVIMQLSNKTPKRPFNGEVRARQLLLYEFLPAQLKRATSRQDFFTLLDILRSNGHFLRLDDGFPLPPPPPPPQQSPENAVASATSDCCENAEDLRLSLRRWGLYPMLGMLNHACRCNASAVFYPDGSARVYALENIEAGDECTINYLDNMHGLSMDERANELFVRYGFLCNCDACGYCFESWRAYWCPACNPERTGAVHPRRHGPELQSRWNDGKPQTSWGCDRCCCAIPGDYASEFLAEERRVLSLVTRENSTAGRFVERVGFFGIADTVVFPEEPIRRELTLDEFLCIRAHDVLHPCHYLLASFICNGMARYMHKLDDETLLRAWDADAATAMVRHYTFFNPVRADICELIGQCHFRNQQFDQAYEAFGFCHMIRVFSCGEQHPLTMRVWMFMRVTGHVLRIEDPGKLSRHHYNDRLVRETGFYKNSPVAAAVEKLEKPVHSVSVPIGNGKRLPFAATHDQLERIAKLTKADAALRISRSESTTVNFT